MGVITAATIVDHINPHKGDQALFWDQSNWQVLCKQCHDRKTAETDGRWGGGSKSLK
jgi:5-methylcytosine-specific restriction protein A